MPKGRRNGKGAPRKRTVAPRPMNKPAMMDWALRLLRLLNEKKVLTSRIVEAEFNVNIRTAQRYLLYLSVLPCVVADEEKHTYTLTSDYVITDKILNTSEMALVCALIDYATHIFGKEHSKFLAGLKNRIFRMPDVYQIVKDEAIDMEKVAAVQLAVERHIKAREVISFLYRRSGKRYTVEPCKILYHGGFWYLVAMHDGVVKKFLLDFIEGIRATGRACGEIPESARKTLSDAQTIWFQDKAPDRVTVEFDANVAHFFERKSIFPRQEIVQKEKDGKIVVSFDVHNDMDFREHIARWMPFFRVVSPGKYRSYILDLCEKVTKRNI
ncbi:MAG: helix-turn-helix transcriptional regulator [Desulfobacteria bacterium]